MIMSSPIKAEPLSAFLAASDQKRQAYKMPPLQKPAVRPSAVELAIKQLDLNKSDSKSASSAITTTSRPLQPLDVNLSKAARQEASTSRCSPCSSSSPKLSSSRTPTARKVRSPSSKDITACSRSAAKASKPSSSLLSHSTSSTTGAVTIKGERISVKIPQKLPTPRLKTLSSPYENLASHLARHHLFSESQQVEKYKIAPDDFLTQYLDLAHLGKCSLYHQTRDFLNANRDSIAAHVRPGELLPVTVPLDVSDLVSGLQVPPTHLLAVHSDNEGATLYAVHGVVLALQCVTIPFLPAYSDREENGKVIRDMATLALRVPAPQHFNTMLRWLYSQSPTSLLQELLPLKHIVTHLTQRNLAQRQSAPATKQELDTDLKTEADSNVDVSKLAPLDLVEAMSTMSTRTFLELLQTIQAVWKNGVAMGILSWGFWTQLDKAWNLVIGAMVASKRKSQYKAALMKAASTMATANELTAQMESARIE